VTRIICNTIGGTKSAAGCRGKSEIRVRFAKAVGAWFDLLFVSPKELEAIISETDWLIEKFIGPEETNYLRSFGRNDHNKMKKIEKPAAGEFAPETIMYIALLQDDELVLNHLGNNLKATTTSSFHYRKKNFCIATPKENGRSKRYLFT
jgi:hypothetical protein